MPVVEALEGAVDLLQQPDELGLADGDRHVGQAFAALEQLVANGLQRGHDFPPVALPRSAIWPAW